MDSLRDAPCAQLEELLARLKLATPGQIRSVAGHARRIAGELPLFESVWVDALARARLLTPFQAAQINAGRGESLAVGPFVLSRPLCRYGYADCYEAQERATGRVVRLLVADKSQTTLADAAGRLQQSISDLSHVISPYLLKPERCGVDEGRLWSAALCPACQTAERWLMEHGRFPPEVVLHIARSLCTALAALERSGLSHGDLNARTVLLCPDGGVLLAGTGVRAALRPAEGYAFSDLPPEAYDGIAPERIHSGAPSSTSTDLFSLGALLWYLLAGRPPFAGGNSLTKLRAIDIGQPVDVRRLAPATPEILAETTRRCLDREPAERPASAHEIAQFLRPPTHDGARELASCLQQPQHCVGGWAPRPPRRKSHKLRAAGAAALAVFAIAGAVFIRSSATTANRRALTKASSPPDSRLQAPNDRPRQTNDAAGIDRRGKGSVSHASFEVAHRAVLLPSGKPISLEVLRLQPGQVVRGRDATRPQIEVPRQGMVIAGDDFVLENIDFIWLEDRQAVETVRPAIIIFDADQAELRNCTFQCETSGGLRPAAIRWKQKSAPNVGHGRWQLGELSMVNCIVAGTHEAVACQRSGAVTIEMSNCLALAAGPILSLASPPGRDDTISLNLSHVTLRESGAVVHCSADSSAGPLGMIRIAASACVFAPDEGRPLIELVSSEEHPDAIKSIVWTGQDSLLSIDAMLAGRQLPEGRIEPIADELVVAAGLVRSQVRFAGGLRHGWQGSRVLDWQGPVSSQDPPGILNTQQSSPSGGSPGEFDNNEP